MRTRYAVRGQEKGQGVRWKKKVKQKREGSRGHRQRRWTGNKAGKSGGGHPGGRAGRWKREGAAGKNVVMQEPDRQLRLRARYQDQPVSAGQIGAPYKRCHEACKS